MHSGSVFLLVDLPRFQTQFLTPKAGAFRQGAGGGPACYSRQGLQDHSKLVLPMRSRQYWEVRSILLALSWDISTCFRGFAQWSSNAKDLLISPHIEFIQSDLNLKRSVAFWLLQPWPVVASFGMRPPQSHHVRRCFNHHTAARCEYLLAVLKNDGNYHE